MAMYKGIAGYHIEGDLYCADCLEKIYFKEHGDNWKEQLENDVYYLGGVINQWEDHGEDLYCSVCHECFLETYKEDESPRIMIDDTNELYQQAGE